jgi:hypothetical protein
MAISISGSTTRVVGIDEFIDYAHTNIDLHDMDSVAAAAPMFRALANDRELVVRQLNRQIKAQYKSQSVASAQVIYVGEGRDFYIRANVWPSNADIASGRVYQDQFAYNLAHDHNYNFMTVGYLGPGYITEIYEYDYERLEGYVGEKVEFRFLERKHFHGDMVMLYRASKDVHIQMPPDDLSVTLNFMVSTPEVRLRDQFFFDLQSRTLMDYPAELDASRRISVLKMAGHVGNDNTRQLLDDLAQSHPCRRTRLAAYESSARLTPGQAARIWEAACRDAEPLVVHTAEQQLANLATGTRPGTVKN